MDDEDSRTIYCGNIAEDVTDELLYELFLQVAPLERISVPQDRGGRKPNYAFIIFKHQESVPYVVRLLDGISLCNKRLNIKPRSKNSNNLPSVRFAPPSAGMSSLLLMTNQYFQNLMHMSPYGAMDGSDSHPSGDRGRTNDSRDNRNYRREERKPYGRNDRHGRNADRHENFRKNRY